LHEFPHSSAVRDFPPFHEKTAEDISTARSARERRHQYHLPQFLIVLRTLFRWEATVPSPLKLLISAAESTKLWGRIAVTSALIGIKAAGQLPLIDTKARTTAA
jgi:hypothetical protein